MYTTTLSDKSYINITAAGTGRRDSATSGFIQPGLRRDDVLQSAASAEIAGIIDIACRLDDDGSVDTSFGAGQRAESINRANENAAWS